MRVLILLDDECPAIYDGKKWDCPDRKARMVLEYFTERLPAGYHPNRVLAVAQFVVSRLPGSQIEEIEQDAHETKSVLPPGAIF